MHSFTLADSQGKAHNYVVNAHPAGEGTPLVLYVISLAAEPIGRLVETKAADLIDVVINKIASGELSPDDDVSKLKEVIGGEDVQRLLHGIEWSRVAADIRVSLAALDTPQLIRQVLKYTHRDGKNLALDGEYDQAYTRNYMELFKAVWAVVQFNGFAGFTISLVND